MWDLVLDEIFLIENMVLNIASEASNDSYAKANKFLCTIKENGYLKIEDFSENKALHRKLENRISTYLEERSQDKSIN